MTERAVGMLQECPSGHRLQRRFKEFGSTSKRPHNCRPRATTPACNSLGLHNQRISACTIPAKLSHMLVSTCLQFVVIADSGKYADPMAAGTLRVFLHWWVGGLPMDRVANGGVRVMV